LPEHVNSHVKMCTATRPAEHKTRRRLTLFRVLAPVAAAVCYAVFPAIFELRGD
jgi:hypothetical protein